MKMVNVRGHFRGKKVKVAFYRYFEDKPYKIVTGKVISIHTARTPRDTSTIELLDTKGRIHTGGYKNYFVIKEVKK